jgi:iron complex outermembrane recepter protein
MIGITRRRGLTLGASSVALGVALLGAGVASAQSAPQQAANASDKADEEISTEVTVTGVRAALDSAAEIKRRSVLIVDSVSAEDIGKLPDVSIADSLARIPGVTAQRLEGRDQRLSIRGLGPDFSTTLLNGREQVTVGDNRGVEFDQYPAEFFRNVNVYKSADASLVPAGIAGTVDLRLLRPLDQSGRVIVVSARGQINELPSLNPDSSNLGYRASGTYVDKFANDTLGVAIGFAAASIPTQNERYNAWGYATDAQGRLILGGAKPYVQSNQLDRYGVVATVEWNPNDRLHSTLDFLYSNFTENQLLRGIEFPLGFSGDPVLSNTTFQNGFLTAGTFSNVTGVQRNDLNRRTAESFALGWNNVFKINDSLRFTLDGSWSRATRTDFLLETYTGTGYNRSGRTDTLRLTQQPNGTFRIVPTLNYADTSLFRITDPQGWGFNGTTTVVQAGFLNQPSFTDDLKAIRAQLTGDLGGIFKDWEIGFNFTRRQKDSAYTSFFLCPRGAGTGCTLNSGTPTSAPVPAAAQVGSNVSLGYLGVPQMLTLNPDYVFNNLLNAVFDNRPGSLVRDNRVTENVATLYAKVDIDGDVGGKAVRGSLGVQAIHTRQSSDGTISNFQAVTLPNGTQTGVVTVLPVTGVVNYWRVLPSATLSVELQPQLYVKLGASSTIVRPRLDQERINQEFNVTLQNIGNPVALNSPFSSNGGNVALRPYQAINIDASIEKYFRGGGYVSLAGYFKKLTSFVEPNRSTTFNFVSALGQLPPAQRAIVAANGWTVGLLTAPQNSGRGELLGAEATISLPLNLVTRALDGFGIFSSASYNYSQIRYSSNPGVNITLPGLSDFVTTNTVYYEKYGFQARLTYRYRSDFLGEVAGLSANPTFRQAQGEDIMDAQIGYEFRGGFLKGLTVLAQAKNLLDTPFITYQNNDRRQVIDYQRYGRDFYLGLTYRF